MEVVDWAIVLVMALAVLMGLALGFFRSVCALGGLLAGLVLAAWNYQRMALSLIRFLRSKPTSEAIAFLLITLLIMCVAGIIGSLLARIMRRLGLGFLDKLAGAVFGFFQGALLTAAFIAFAVAYFPGASWMAEGKLPKMFFEACHLNAHMNQKELSQRIQQGLAVLKEESPHWMHRGNGGV